MKPLATQARTEGSIGERVAMRLDSASTAHLMSLMTNVYSDPIEACIREYPTNGNDSHNRAGQTRPIEVSLPSAFVPEFVVQDFGTGMDADDLRDTYSAYGASTKRGDNIEAGMFGLGCKAALTYVDSFTLHCVKDGKLVTAAVMRGDDGIPTINILPAVDTDLYNGVKVTIPVRPADIETFQQKARKFFAFWEEGTVKVDGKVPRLTDFFGEVVKLDATTFIVAGEPDSVTTYDRNSYVVMGQVAYPVRQDFRMSEGLAWSYRIVTTVPMGSLSLPPSREELLYDDHTKAGLEKERQRVARLIDSYRESFWSGVTTRGEALKTHREEAALFGNRSSNKWNGETIPSHLKLPEGSRTGRLSGVLSAMNTLYVLGTDVSGGFVTVHGKLPQSGLSATMRRRLAKLMEDKGTEGSYIICASDPDFHGGWLSEYELARYDYADVKAVKLPKAAKTQVTSSDKFGYVDDGPIRYYRNGCVPIDNSEGHVIVSGAAMEDATSSSYSRWRLMHDALRVAQDVGITIHRIYDVGLNRQDKIMRENDKVRTLADVLGEAVAKLDESGLTVATPWTKLTDNIDPGDDERFDDPDVRRYFADERTAESQEGRDARAARRTLLGLAEYDESLDSEPETCYDEVLERYPLLRAARGTDVNHLAEYVNHIYAKDNDNE